jgi:hypothetical protein
MRFGYPLIGISLTTLAVVACSANTDSTSESNADLEAARSHPHDAGTTSTDAGTPPSDAGTSTGGDDGTPTRLQCTSNFGSGLSTGSHGRLDGTLVAIVAPGSTSGCNDDAHHVHLQIAMGGSTYDVAVNVDQVLIAEKDAPMVNGAWSEGWNSNAPLDFPTSLGLHSGDFQSVTEAQLTQQLEQELANVNHISVYATKYSKGGIHLVHRNGNGNDGALVLEPLSANPHYIVVHFPNQTF